MDESRIKEALSLQLDEYVPLSDTEAIFDYDIISDSVKNKERIHLHLNIAAFPKSFVESYRDVFIGAGFVPVAFEMEAQAFARAIVPKEEMDNVMVIDLGRTKMTFAVVSKGKVQFTTTVALAGEEIEKAFIKKAFIKDEATKQTAYWVSRNEDDKKNDKISKIILCGGESALAGLPEFLSCELKMKVELGNPWVNVASFEDYIPEIERIDSLSYSTVIGLALKQWIN